MPAGMSPKVLAVWLLAICAIPAAGRAAAPASDFARYLDSAIQLYRIQDFARALEQVASARAQPHGADEAVQAFLWEGLLRDELGDEEKACAAFRTALSLDLEAQLPVQVRQRVGLAFELEREKLRQLKREAATVAPNRPPPPPPTVVVAQPVPARPLRLWAIAPVAAGGAGVVVGGALLGVARTRYDALVSGAARPEDARPYRDSGKALQAAGWTLTALGIAAAAAGTVFLLLPSEPGAPEPAAQVALAPALLPGGGGLLLTGALP